MWGRTDPRGPGPRRTRVPPFLWDPATGQSAADRPAEVGGRRGRQPVLRRPRLPARRPAAGDGRARERRRRHRPGLPVRPGREHLDADGADEQRPLVSDGDDPARRPGPGAGGQLQAGCAATTRSRTSCRRSGRTTPGRRVRTLPRRAPFPLYPRMHVTGRRTLLMSGQLAQTWTLTTAGAGQWSGDRAAGDEPSATTVRRSPMRSGQIIYLGGGNDADNGQPTDVVEMLDLTAPGTRPGADRPDGVPPAAAQRDPAGRRHGPGHRGHPR